MTPGSAGRVHIRIDRFLPLDGGVRTALRATASFKRLLHLRRPNLSLQDRDGGTTTRSSVTARRPDRTDHPLAATKSTERHQAK